MLEAGLSQPAEWLGDDLPPSSAVPEGPTTLGRLGPYELLEEIGRGGMGIVYRARDLRINRTVAIKLMLAGQFAGGVEVKRFRAEAEAAARLDHPNIVPIYEVGEQDGRPFYSMKLMEGGSLMARVGPIEGTGPVPAEARLPGPLDGRQAASTLSKIARAVHHAHQRAILHRDLKPGNILLDAQGEPHVSDFGLAKRLDRAEGLTLSGAMLGSPGYMSPEQASSRSEDLTTASDTYSLGALLYQLLTGRPPFAAATPLAIMEKVAREDPVPPRVLRPEIDPDLETICLKCLEKDPQRRYASADALAEDLDRWLAHKPIHARPVGSVERLNKWIWRNPKVAVLLVLLGLVLVGGVSAVVVMNVRLISANRAKDAAHARLARQIQDLQWQKIDELIAKGKRGDALAYLAHLLRLNPQDRPAATRSVSMLSACRFALPENLLLQHGAGVNAMDLSQDGQQLVTAAADGNVRVWSLAQGHLIATLRHASNVTQSAFVSDERFVLTTTQDGASRLWNWREHHVTFSFPKAPDSAFGGLLSRDRRYLALLATENSMQLWDPATCQPAGEPMRLPARIRWLDFSPDGRQAAVASADGSVGIWDLPAVRPRGPPVKIAGDISRVRFSPDGTLLAIAWRDQVSLLRAHDGQTVRELVGLGGQVLQTEFSPDGRRLVCMAYDSPLKIWDLSSGQPLGQPIEAERPFAFFSMTPDGLRLATRSGAGLMRIWDASTGQPLCEPFEHESGVTDLRFTPDGQRLVTASRDGTARLWAPQRETPAGLTRKTSDSQPVARFSHDGSRIFWTSNRAAEILDLRTGMRIGEPMRHEGVIYRMAESSDGKKLATASWDNTARIWDAHSGRPFTPPLAHRWRPFAIAFSPDNQWLATGGAEALIRIWNAESGRPEGADLEHPGAISSIRFRPDSQVLLASSQDGTAQSWRVATGQPLWPEPIRHKGSVTSAEFSPDGRRIVTASADRSARVWDAETGRPLGVPLLHERGVVAAHFSPDGKWILTCAEDGTARTWDAQSGDPLSEPMRHKQRLTDGVFSPDGRWVFTGSRGGETRLWDALTGYPVSEPFTHPGRVTAVGFAPDGQQCLSIADSDALRLWTVIDAPVPVPDWFPTFIEAVAGKRINARGEAETTGREFLEVCRQKGSDAFAHGFYDRWARWFVVERLRQSGAPPKP